MRQLRINLSAVGAAALTAAGLACAQPQVQQGGPVIVGERKEGFKNFELEFLEAALELYGESRYDRQKQQGEQSITDRDAQLRETLDVAGQAAIGHRNLLDLSFRAQVGLEQQYTDSDSQKIYDQWSDSLVDLYDIRGLLLGNGPVPVTIYTMRDEYFDDEPFTGTLQNVLSESGIQAQIVSARAPTTLHYFHREQDQSNQLGTVDFNVRQDNFSIQSGILITPNQVLDLNYNYAHVDENQPNFDDRYDQNDGNLVHTLTFGEKNRSQLRSSLRYFDQTGLADQSELRWDERLVARHSDTLETRYNFIADQQSSRGLDQTFFRGDAQVRHWLFDSLISTANVGGQHLESGDFTSDDFFTFGTVEYTKKVYKGQFDASAGIAYNAQHNGPQGATLSVINEPHVFIDPNPIILSRRNIVEGSVVITGAAGFPTYQEGTDYTVQYFPDRAQINVIYPGGGINNGESLLIDYQIGPEPASEIDTLGTTLSVRYGLTEGMLRGLAAYTIYRSQNNWLDTADPSLFALDDFTALRYGVEYVNAGFDLKAEQDTRDSSTFPYDATRFHAIYTGRIGRDTDLRVHLSHELIDYPSENNTVKYYRALGQWDQRLGTEFAFRVRLEYRQEDSTLQGNSTALEEVVGFTWRRRQTSIYGSFTNTNVETDSSSTLSQAFEFGIRRAF